MLEVLARLIGTTAITISVFYIINKIINLRFQKISITKGLILLLQIIIICILYPIHYSGLYSISIFFLYVISYKIIFNLKKEEALISCGLMMIILFLSDLIISLLFMSQLPISIIRTNPILVVVTNLCVSVLSVIIISQRKIVNMLHSFYYNIQKRKLISNVLFFVLLVIYFSYLLNNIGISEFFNKEYIINTTVFIIFIIITFIFVRSRNEYNQLSSEYDSLFSYVQNFEDWIDKEQLNRHEYKNQLAVIRCLTKEKKVKAKIDEILEDNINIEDQAVTNFKNLPKGGIKGLMYYKAAIAQKHRLHLTTDVNINTHGILSKLSEENIRKLCKLIGIYFDNAIEAAEESKKKNIMIEVYELKNKVSFVFSNTFKKNKNMKDRNKKGVSSKGEGRGNGLYFAEKIIKENTWLEQKQEIIDNYYIQQIIIKNSID